MRLLIMLVPMLMIGCDGSRESFTIKSDIDGVVCASSDYNTLGREICCPSGFSPVGYSYAGGAHGSQGNTRPELVCLQD